MFITVNERQVNIPLLLTIKVNSWRPGSVRTDHLSLNNVSRKSNISGLLNTAFGTAVQQVTSSTVQKLSKTGMHFLMFLKHILKDVEKDVCK